MITSEIKLVNGHPILFFDGKKTITLPHTAEVTPLNTNNHTFISDKIEIEMKEFETLIYKVK